MSFSVCRDGFMNYRTCARNSAATHMKTDLCLQRTAVLSRVFCPKRPLSIGQPTAYSIRCCTDIIQMSSAKANNYLVRASGARYQFIVLVRSSIPYTVLSTSYEHHLKRSRGAGATSSASIHRYVTHLWHGGAEGRLLVFFQTWISSPIPWMLPPHDHYV